MTCVATGLSCLGGRCGACRSVRRIRYDPVILIVRSCRIKLSNCFANHKSHNKLRPMHTLNLSPAAPKWLAPAVIGLGLVMIAGCIAEPKRVDRSINPEPRVVTVSTTSTVDQLMALILEARKLSAQEFVTERERARADYALDKSDLNRVRLAVLLSLPNAASPANAANFDDEIISLVDPIAFNGANTITAPEPGVRALAVLIQSLVQVRKRQAELARETQVKVQSSRRDEVVAAQQEARNLRLKNEELEKQIAEYKKIDRSVSPPRTPERSDAAPK